MWGEQIWSGSLDTSAGPTWKPLPVLATAALAPLGDGAVTGWLLLARAGGVLAVAGAYCLVRRLDGPTAGVVAAFLLAASPWWFVNTALGNSEGLLVAAVLWAGVAHLMAGAARRSPLPCRRRCCGLRSGRS
jgi:4-amino-4-deoxy-L-arabinose transferase-like glycosyltransferase